jgi:aryl-alcohol dehydrogenase-like predicted oxidoreductase
MLTRKLGCTPLHLTTVGFGTWAAGGGGWQWGWGPQDDAHSIAAIHRALDLGINWLDTAPAYGLGHSEEVVAEALEGRPDVIVATKCGLVWDEGGTQIYDRLTAESVRRECEASLRRLKRDAIDLYQVHWPRDEEHLEEGWAEIAKLVEDGKVRYAGVSNFSVAQMERVRPIHPIASLQPPYSMLARGVESELLPYCAANEIGVVVYSPMASGLLTGKVTPEWVAGLAEEDWRRKVGGQFREPNLSANLALVQGLQGIAAREGHSVGELAVAWTLRRPEVTSAIVGARSPRQIAEIAPAAGWQLLPAELTEVEELLAARQSVLG